MRVSVGNSKRQERKPAILKNRRKQIFRPIFLASGWALRGWLWIALLVALVWAFAPAENWSRVLGEFNRRLQETPLLISSPASTAPDPARADRQEPHP